MVRRQNLRKMRLSRFKKSKLDEHLQKQNAKNEDLEKCKSMEVSKYSSAMGSDSIAVNGKIIQLLGSSARDEPVRENEARSIANVDRSVED